MDEHAMIFTFHDLRARAEDMGLSDLDALIALQNRLAQAIEPGGLGKVDGNEIAMDGSEGALFAFGPNAEAMLKAALPIVCASPLARSCTVHVRYGSAIDPTAPDDFFDLADLCATRNS